VPSTLLRSSSIVNVVLPPRPTARFTFKGSRLTSGLSKRVVDMETVTGWDEQADKKVQSNKLIINGNERYDIYVRLACVFRQDVAAISELRLLAPNGAWLRLADITDIAIESGPPQVRRDDVQRRVVIQANIQGRDMGSVVTEIRQAISQQVELPRGYSVQIGGQFESQQRAQQRLMLVVPLSLALIALLYL